MMSFLRVLKGGHASGSPSTSQRHQRHRFPVFQFTHLYLIRR
ncbi:hypothetical protein M8C21_008661 [Ambrosia artemisiifolia]|uniref:Uncharacterized protein n=1 Tax=Ambrosia artemisiifolia TaxID=4212 RepID=A0AAD5GBK5_AMBAR|nr:hypothetical protein M8C21_008661 [Ambrosia artemisiifolia]